MIRGTLTEICSAVVDCKNRTAPEDPNGSHFAVGTPAMRGNIINLSEARRINDETYAEWTARITPEPGDLLFAREAPVGPVVEIPEGVSIAPGQRTMLLRADPSKANGRFLRYYLISPSTQARIQSLAHGSTVPHLRLPVVRNFEVELPKLEEQHAIAEVLGALDDKIAANTKLAETSSQLAQSIFAAAATNTEGVKVGLSESSHLLSRGITPKYSEDEDTMTILNQKCVRDQRVNLTPARRTDLVKVREEKILSQNDVLVNSTGQGTLGRVARWTHDKRVTVDSHITIIRFNPEEVDPVCAGFSVLRSEREITDMAEGSTGQTELSRIELGKLKILLPPREQQQELGQRLAKMAAMENAYLQENERLAAIRDALLPQLISGKLRVKNAEKVVEDKL